mmetsp:Transcript_23481/g.35450  ORF Transcript_23481/g.35450 Transcript_23481/m.35450 type:complete len:182 (+) Transcript_23481:74-619(+)|eukprot:CAMPEP_0206424738 /NCGR_PEP_ID=MMETSP0324_2-20121206/3402_1 /ASSEMBLY_ACC=CAM_ASM_000836 /TAXON_ID=2866 /ORGANISM="Crypthecodinium cohnii, Strain Seligo" /LENGTH=181 /DNA_ID=CAMNT_0053889441 /DNA_START=8 /DNA_END=553 /DNA_ORIENTATION=-
MSNDDRHGASSASNKLSNIATELDEAFRTAFQPLHAGGNGNAVALPVAMLGGLFAATLAGALSYRRAAQHLAKTLPPQQPVMPPQASASGSASAASASAAAAADDAWKSQKPPKALAVLTKGELVRLFVVPGIFAAVLVAAIGGLCRWTLDVDNVEDGVRQVRWLLLGGVRPTRTQQPPEE